MGNVRGPPRLKASIGRENRAAQKQTHWLFEQNPVLPQSLLLLQNWLPKHSSQNGFSDQLVCDVLGRHHSHSSWGLIWLVL